jgi:thiamine monophosphate kinase
VILAAELDAAIHADAQALAARTGRTARDHALGDGEDFELIFALPADADERECRRLGLLPLGYMASAPGLALQHADRTATPLQESGWEHFQ